MNINSNQKHYISFELLTFCFRPFGTRKNHILELNEIPSVYSLAEPKTKEEEAEEKHVPQSLLNEISPEDDALTHDHPPCYQELFLNPAMLETADLPTYSEVLEAIEEK